MREGGEDRVLIDPAAWSQDGADALAEWAPSDDGRLVAYTVQEGGTDWRTIRVLDVEIGEVLLHTAVYAGVPAKRIRELAPSARPPVVDPAA